MHLHWPQITYLVITGIGLVCVASMDGKPIKENHSFAKSLCRNVILGVILYCGGFFTGQ